jgi:hypothetical protein
LTHRRAPGWSRSPKGSLWPIDRYARAKRGWLRDERFDLDLIGLDGSELERLLALAEGEATATRTRFPNRPRSRSRPVLRYKQPAPAEVCERR